MDIDIKEVKISGRDIADSPDVKEFLKQNPSAKKIDFNNTHIGIHTSGWRKTYLGHIVLSLQGTLYFDSDGKPKYDGYISAMPDENDYEKSNFRNLDDETATATMRVIGKATKAKTYKIRIRGAQYLNE